MPSVRHADHATQCLRIVEHGDRDLGDLWSIAYHLDGFSRVWLRPKNGGGTIIMFKNIKYASSGLSELRSIGVEGERLIAMVCDSWLYVIFRLRHFHAA